MFKGSSSSSQGDLNGFLDAGSHIEGKLKFEDTFRVDGKVTGSVISDGDLIVGDRGEIDGEVNVRRVFVSGIVRGQLRGKEKVEITASGKVWADITTPRLMIEEGALFEGHCSMGSGKGAKASAGTPEKDRESEGKIARMPGMKG
ncbi:MAG: polymer-forming cytoskeletal protein [Acidobacteriota bacterium]